ncbi:MAG: glycosyltransferase family A protein, partial [Candidatus Omnitrophota bacterium]
MHLYFGKEVYWYKDSSYAIVDILIPSCKELCDLVPLLQEIKNNSSNFRLIVASNPGKSAAYNRNRCLEASEAPFVIMMDDDISGLYPGWDLELITSLQLDAAISIVSARLLQPDGYTPGPMMSSKKDLSGDF